MAMVLSCVALVATAWRSASAKIVSTEVFLDAAELVIMDHLKIIASDLLRKIF